MSKLIRYGNEAREKVLSGVEKLAKTVAVTMGPAGKTVIIGKPIGAPVATKDGVTVAREVTLEDPLEELGCQLVKEVAGRSAQMAGDGTTTSTVLTYEIFKNGNDLINQGYLPLNFKYGIQMAKNLVVDEIKKHSTVIDSESKHLFDIATISANNDSEIGELIAKSYAAVGKDGLVLAEAIPGIKSKFKLIDGIELDSGYVSPGFLPANDDKIILSNPLILVIDEELNKQPQNNFLNTLQYAIEKSRPLVIFCQDMKSYALNFFVENYKKNALNVAVVKLPKFTRNRVQWLQDLCALTSATLIGGNSGLGIEQISHLYFGEAGRIIINNFKTSVISPKKDTQLISARLSDYKSSFEHLIGESDAKDIQERIGFLSNKIAVISVGYSTELELRELGDRIEDSIAATKAALQEGYLPGGGFALYKICSKLLGSINDLPPGYRGAAEVLYKSCMVPAQQIISNAGLNPEEILEKIDLDKFTLGYNTASGQYCDLVEAGILDPTKVTRVAVENAVSISTILITTDAVMAENPKNPSSWQPEAGYRLPKDQGLNHKY